MGHREVELQDKQLLARKGITMKSEHEIMEEMAQALKLMLKAYEMILPGVAKIAVNDYALLNGAPCAARDALQEYESAAMKGESSPG